MTRLMKYDRDGTTELRNTEKAHIEMHLEAIAAIVGQDKGLIMARLQLLSHDDDVVLSYRRDLIK